MECGVYGIYVYSLALSWKKVYWILLVNDLNGEEKDFKKDSPTTNNNLNNK